MSMKSMFAKRDNLSALQKQLEDLNAKGGFESVDLPEWTLQVNKSGIGNAVIRFLDDPSMELPFVKLINHGFKFNNRWYIENCPTTHGSIQENFEKCPVCSKISEEDLYNTNNQLYSQLKRKTSYWSKILVLKDDANPSNEGQVFAYRFGVKIMEKIQAAANADPELGETPINVFCPVEGANFILKATLVDKNRNYDTSNWQRSAPIPGLYTGDKLNEEFAEKLAGQMQEIKLMDLVDDSQFKSQEDLEKRFTSVMGTEESRNASSIQEQLDDLDGFGDDGNVDVDAISTGGVKTTKKKKETVATEEFDVDAFLDGDE